MASIFSSRQNPFTVAPTDPGVTDLGLGSNFGDIQSAPARPKGRTGFQNFARFAAGFAGPETAAQLFASDKVRAKTLQDQIKALNKNISEQIKNMVAQAGTEAKLAAANGDFGKAREIIEQTTRLGGFMLERRSPTPGALPKFQNDMRNLSLSLAGEETSARRGRETGKEVVAKARAKDVPVPGSVEEKNLQGVLRTFRMPDGSFQSVRATSAEIDTIIAQGGIETPVSVQAGSVGDLGSPTKEDVAEAKDIILESTGNIQDLANNLAVLERTQGAAGLRGGIAEFGAGLLTQIPGIGSSLGEAFSQSVAGASQQAVTDARTRSRLMVSRMLRTITNETSGRYTDRERAIAEEALKTLRPEAGFDQIRAALKVAMEFDVFARERAKIKAGVTTAFMTQNEKEIVREAQRFMKLGFSKDEAIDLVERLVDEASVFREQLGGNQSP